MEPSAVSSRRALGPCITLFKRVVRKSIRWYVRPQVDELAGAAQAELAHLRTTLAERHAAWEARLAEWEARLGRWEQQMGEYRACLDESTQAELTRLHARLADAEARNAEIQSSSLAQLLEVVKQMEELRELQHSLTESAEPEGASKN